MMKENCGERGRGHFKEALENIAAAKGVKKTDLDVKALVGQTAGEVYKLLEGKGAVPFRQIKEGLPGRGPLASMAVGWLLKEDKLEVKVLEDGVSVRLK